MKLCSGLVVLCLCLTLGVFDAAAAKKKRKKKVAKPAAAKVEAATPAAGAGALDALGAAPLEAPPGGAAVPSVGGAAQGQPSGQAFGDTYRIKVVVMPLTGGPSSDASFLAALTQVIPETLDRLGPFKAISTADVQQMLSFEVQKQMLGCTESSCLAELGGALGADFIVAGSLTTAGSTQIVQLSLMNVSAGRVDARLSRDYSGASDGLFAELRGATQVLVRDILGQRSGTLVLVVSEEGASVKVDGSIVGVSPVQPLTLSGGAHRVEVEKEGFIVYRQDVSVPQESTLELKALLVPSLEFRRAYAEHASFTRSLGLGAVTVGALALGGSAALYFKASSAARDLNRDVDAYNAAASRPYSREQELADDQAHVAMLDVLTLAAAGVGVASAVVGVVLLATGDDPDRYEIVPSAGVAQTASPSIGVRVGLLSPTVFGLSGWF